MTVFEARYNNDEVSSLAYDPTLLLTIILAAYARGLTKSQQIERLCKENVVFMTLSADSQPHFATIAKFIGQMSDVILSLSTEILLVCGNQGLIGRDMLAIDGCKMASNALKEYSGIHVEITKKHKNIGLPVRRMPAKHRDEDTSGQINDHSRRASEQRTTYKFKRGVAQDEIACKEFGRSSRH